ncbi:MAG TPA: pyridoxamine 5'-phosphate oxidase family protein [Xanthobacteraceae bacterium]|jgi:predicted pyridoxine 5'-phosphate oxidase superfamily flavin-nucleotide-binding protein|nr:pyridoxamine 5'-phosphate oxidase family protein [Xanthobacteraceae bacterium]
MTSRFLNLVFSPSVKEAQQRYGSREAYSRRDGTTEPDQLTENEAQFIATRDSMYMASIGANGWPYIQHRGGPPGFIKVLNARSLGIADFRGNRQYVSVGNLADDNRVALFLMDYPRRARLKILGRARAVDLAQASDLASALIDPGYGAKVERGIVIDVEAFDWNCPQHITPRYTLAEIEPSIAALKARIAELEAEVVKHRAMA